MPVPYIVQSWQNDDPSRPVSAERLEHMEQGIFDASNVLVLEANESVPVGTPAGTVIIKKDS